MLVARRLFAFATLLYLLRTAGCRCSSVEVPALRASDRGLGANALRELRQRATLVAARSRAEALRLRGGKDIMMNLDLPTGAEEGVEDSAEEEDYQYEDKHEVIREMDHWDSLRDAWDRDNVRELPYNPLGSKRPVQQDILVPSMVRAIPAADILVPSMVRAIPAAVHAAEMAQASYGTAPAIFVAAGEYSQGGVVVLAGEYR
ncbi:hypothetical protein T484DRAFT_1827941 [Baffinella frigidus]|nr:hypothetical protein T484DRAFT_1827941 [Cryptophyta sp. CCMP2293]